MFHVITAFGLAAALLAVPAPDEKSDKKAVEEAAKKAVEDFKTRIKDCKTPHEKALAVQALGYAEPKDACMVSSVAKYLAPGANDPCYLLPVTAADALGRFRGIASASQALSGSLPAYKKIPYVYNRLTLAIGRVGHESALPMFEDQVKNGDPDAAVAAVQAIAEFPPVIALETLFKEYDRMEKRRPKASEPEKALFDKAQPEIVKAAKKIAQVPYPTYQEIVIWWGRRGKEETIKKEKEKAATAAEPGTAPSAPTTLPPVLLVELLFRENAGASTANSGATGGSYATASLTASKPGWSTVIPPNGGPSAIDFDRNPGAYAVDLGGGPGVEPLKGLKSFTISGWTICMESKEGPSDKLAGGGNRIVSWLNPVKFIEGVELIYRSDGSLQLGVNQWADQGAKSAVSQIPLYDQKATEAGAEQWKTWRFFAVTYDSTASAGHAKFYFGNRNGDAKLAGQADYARGVVGAKIAPQVTVGNVPLMIRAMAPERSYRGILDEIRIHGSSVDGTGALTPEQLIKLQNRTVPNTP